ncbi:MAG: hypothetical protein L0H64_11105 [Pseudonocardia sp.]|nr:hypothetical protein [Pseudonocardia sp.]
MTVVDDVVADAVLAAVDVAHGRGDDDHVARVLAEHLAGATGHLADAVTVGAVMLAGELLAELAETRGVERGRIPGRFSGRDW